MLPLIMAGIGAAGGIINEIQRAKQMAEESRREEEQTRIAQAGMMQAREANQLQNPQAAARQQMQAVQAGQTAANAQALNAAAGAGASSGDMGNELAQALRGSTAVAASNAPYAQQMTQIAQNAQQQEQQRQAQALDINKGIGALASDITYVNKASRSPNIGNAILSGVTGAVGGANSGNSLVDLLMKKRPDTTAQTPLPEPEDNSGLDIQGILGNIGGIGGLLRMIGGN